MAEVNSKSGMGLKEHQLLLVFATELKTIAQQLDVFIYTASQLNGEAQNAQYKDQNLLAGSKALANKLDMGVISMAPTKAEKKKIESVLHKMVNMPVPNMCHWVYKVRRGRLTRIIIWTKIDLGTMTEQCLFVTNYDFELIDMDFTKIEQVEEKSMMIGNVNVVARNFIDILGIMNIRLWTKMMMTIQILARQKSHTLIPVNNLHIEMPLIARINQFY